MQTFCDNGDFFLLFLSDASLYDGIVWPIIIYHESFNLISKSPTREGGDNIIPVKQHYSNTLLSIDLIHLQSGSSFICLSISFSILFAKSIVSF